MVHKEDPFPISEEDFDYYWSKFPEMSKEEFNTFFTIYKDHSDFENMYKNENNEAQ